MVPVTTAAVWWEIVTTQMFSKKTSHKYVLSSHVLNKFDLLHFSVSKLPIIDTTH